MDLNRNIRPLVSILSPVYNAEKYISRMLLSVLSQSYKNIELICVDDGSDDNTEQVIKSHVPAFEKEGMRLIYTKQSHKGQSMAVNTGLKMVNGEYLSWIDSDDFISEKSIEIKLTTLIDNKEIAIATSDFYTVSENNLTWILNKRGDFLGNLNYQKKQFYLALSGLSIIEANCHLVRMNCFDTVFPKREIISCSEGQNYQLTLPLYYHFKRLFINQPLAYYVIRDDSHYHRTRSAEEIHMRYSLLTEMFKNVLEFLCFSESDIKKLVKISCFNRDR